MIRTKTELSEFIFRAVTHGFLGLLTFLALKIYNSVEDIQKIIAQHEVRISILERNKT